MELGVGWKTPDVKGLRKQLGVVAQALDPSGWEGEGGGRRKKFRVIYSYTVSSRSVWVK